MERLDLWGKFCWIEHRAKYKIISTNSRVVQPQSLGIFSFNWKNQVGAELGQAQVKLEVIAEVVCEVGFEISVEV